MQAITDPEYMADKVLGVEVGMRCEVMPRLPHSHETLNKCNGPEILQDTLNLEVHVTYCPYTLQNVFRGRHFGVAFP